MSTEPKIKSTNPIMGQILKRYVSADSVSGSPPDVVVTNNSADWYNMTCPRCPWFVDGARTGQYTMVNDNNDATVGDMAGDNDAAVGDMAGDSSSAPDNAPVAGKDADGDSGRATGDSERVTGDDSPAHTVVNNSGAGGDTKTAINNDLIGRSNLDCVWIEDPWDEKWDELLDGVDASIDADEEKNWVDTDGVSADGVRHANGVDTNGVDADGIDADGIDAEGRRRVPIVQCVRPESAECLNDSFCVRLLVASDLIRRQAVLDAIDAEALNEVAPFVDGANDAATSGDAGRKPTQREKRNRKLIKAARKRGR